MTTIFIQSAPTGGHHIKLQSDDPGAFKLAIDTLKSFIPVLLRRYDPTTKQWTVVESAGDRLPRWLAYCRAHIQAEVQWLDADASDYEPEAEWTPPSRQLTRAAALKTLYLLPDAPASVIRASYKALSLEFHPDRPTGNTRKQQQLNAAYEALSREVAA